jgi:hypothetical protein
MAGRLPAHARVRRPNPTRAHQGAGTEQSLCELIRTSTCFLFEGCFSPFLPLDARRRRQPTVPFSNVAARQQNPPFEACTATRRWRAASSSRHMTALVADALELLNEKGTDTSTSKWLLHTHEECRRTGGCSGRECLRWRRQPDLRHRRRHAIGANRRDMSRASARSVCETAQPGDRSDVDVLSWNRMGLARHRTRQTCAASPFDSASFVCTSMAAAALSASNASN